MEFTIHAQERLQALTPRVGSPAIRSLIREIEQTPMTGNHAVVIPIRPTKDPHRRQWVASDHIAAIIRNGRVVTVCLTRKKQVSPEHFRVEKIKGGQHAEGYC